MQLAQACTVIASGGLLLKPRLLMDAPKVDPVRVLRPETAITMRSMMEGVVIKPYGTGHKYARLIGYTSAGKTGTAQIYDNRIHQYTHMYNASFMGFAPVTNPRIVIVVTINGTEGTVGYGGPTSAPVFREVAAAGLRVMDVPKDLPEMVPVRGVAIRPTKTTLRSPIWVLPSLPRWSKREMPLPPTTDRWLPQTALWTSGLF